MSKLGSRLVLFPAKELQRHRPTTQHDVAGGWVAPRGERGVLSFSPLGAARSQLVRRDRNTSCCVTAVSSCDLAVHHTPARLASLGADYLPTAGRHIGWVLFSMKMTKFLRQQGTLRSCGVSNESYYSLSRPVRNRQCQNYIYIGSLGCVLLPASPHPRHPHSLTVAHTVALTPY